MKTIKVDEKADKNLKKIAKMFGMSKKSCLNMILENLDENDMLMLPRRNINPTSDSTEYSGNIEFEPEDDEDYEIEFEEGGDDYDFEAEPEVEEISPAEKKKQQLKLDAIKMGFVSEDEIDLFVKRNSE